MDRCPFLKNRAKDAIFSLYQLLCYADAPLKIEPCQHRLEFPANIWQAKMAQAALVGVVNFAFKMKSPVLHHLPYLPVGFPERHALQHQAVYRLYRVEVAIFFIL